MSDDAELLRRYAATHDEAAFAGVVQRHLGLVYAAALRRVGGDAHLAEDVAQQVFTALAQRAGAVAERPVLAGWLYIATRNVAAATVRNERRRRTREEAFETMNAVDATSVQVDWDRLRPVLDAAMDTLRERERDAVLLRFFEGKTFSEIGARLQLQENAARMRVDRAVEKLRRALERRGVTSTVAALSTVLASSASTTAPAGLAANVTAGALAQTAAGITAVSALAFMTTKSAVGVMGGIALLAVGTTMYQTHAAHESARMAATFRTECDHLTAQLTATRQRVQQDESALARAQQPVTSPTAAAVAAKTNPAFSAAHESPLEYALNHPEARSAYLERAALTIKTRFERFFHSAGLSGDQQDRFLKLAMDDAEARLDWLAVRRATGSLNANSVGFEGADTKAVNAELERHEISFAQGLRDLLGEQFTPAMHYLNTMAERNVADRLASELYYTEAPLTAPQADALTQLLMQNRFRGQATATPTDTVGGTFIPRELGPGNIATASLESLAMPWLDEMPVTDAAMAAATSVLSPTQLAALKVLQAQQAAELQLRPRAHLRDSRDEHPK